MIPDHTIILLSGIPATGKSFFAQYLASARGFAHYDLERHPEGWPHPELKEIWDADRAAFVQTLRSLDDRIAIDWGFPPGRLPLVEELRGQGVNLVWFSGDIPSARETFKARGGIALASFEQQIAAITAAGYPGSLGKCVVVPALSGSGAFLPHGEIERLVFG